MRKNIYSLIVFMSASFMMSAQDLYVDSNSYMYVQDEVVFVTNDLRIEDATANIYLRAGAQLIQDNDIKNSDDGELSVYQTPTKNVFGYNYWCSPVGVGADGTARANSTFQRSNMHKPASVNVNETVSATYGSTSAYTATAAAISYQWLYKGLNVNHYYDWVGAVAGVDAGEGFTMKGRVGVGAGLIDEQIDFRGRPNTGTFSIPCQWTAADGVAQDWSTVDALPGPPPAGNGHYVESLIGNPYPSTMDLKLIFANSASNQANLDGTIYFWQEQNSVSHYLTQYDGGYATYIPGVLADLNDHGDFTPAPFRKYVGNGGTATAPAGTGTDYSGGFERRYAAIGQGFFVRSVDDGGGNITIDNSMRAYIKQTNDNTGAIFERSANNANATNQIVGMSHNGLDYNDILNNPTKIGKIRIVSDINDEFYRPSLIAFRNNTDVATYAKFSDGVMSTRFATDTYFIVDDRLLSIKSMQFDINARLPFGIVAGETVNNIFDIKVIDLIDVDADVEIYMYDKVEDTYTDIKNGSFNITLDQGVYNDRFEVTFRTDEDQDNQDDMIASDIEDSFTIFQNNSSANLMIKNPGAYQINSFTMFDVAGKLIFNEANLGVNTEYSFPTNKLSTGTYIVKVGTESDVTITKKVIIHNR